ncbi:MAG: hypothetical protein SGI99_16170 [Pseudomonadota bacterium]|nr:hypothetical protein [Pseudomonadota bacterium]
MLATIVLNFAPAGLGAVAAAPLLQVNSPVEQAVQQLRGDYRQQQWQRLAQNTDRDSLIAAVLLGMPSESLPQPVSGQQGVEQRLAQRFGRDPDALFVLALACQLETSSCAVPDAYQRLVTVAPDNAVHWLLLPNAAAPNASALHSAATAGLVDSRLRQLLGWVRAALADQPAPAAVPGIDPAELASSLRRDAVEQIALPKFAAVLTLCKPPTEADRNDCIALGHGLMSDRSGAILSSMVGVAMVRRLEKGTPADTDAKALRRDYVWFSEQLGDVNAEARERLQVDTIAVGEWKAVESAVLRLGKPIHPDADWVPANPQQLLLSEERTPASTN